MKKLSELQDFFYENIYPNLDFLEEKRIKIYSYLKKVAIMLFIFTCIVIYSLFGMVPDTFNLLILCVAISSAIFTFIYKMKVKDFTSLFKNQVIEKLVLFVDDSLSYNKDSSISEYEYKQSSLFYQKIDKYSGDDLVVGKVDGVDIRFSEVHTEVKDKRNRLGTDSGINLVIDLILDFLIKMNTTFHGLFFIADFNKNFKGKTLIVPDKSEKFLGSFSHFFQSFSSRGELVKMDNPKFEKEFVIYSDDQIEARYILSHSLMESILEYKKLVGKNISISFVKSNIYIAIGFREKLFEPKIYKKITSFNEVKFYFQVLCLTTEIVKHLNLDRRLWSKR